MITIIDYGLGNVDAFVNSYRRSNVEVTIARTAEEVSRAEKIILPGVGAFDWAMQRLERSGMRPKLDEMVMKRGVPVLGVCVGMQLMARRSEEGHSPGLGWIGGDVRHLERPLREARINELPLPHMGWNDVKPRNGARLFAGIEPDARFYFLHSYYLQVDVAEDVLAQTTYTKDFASAIERANVLGVQFHPEKSHSQGVRLLKNFAEL